jgi:hypothetical protein
MSDFHDNIFYYYRGGRHPQHERYDQQLEDNTTKALANTLTHCDPGVLVKFLHWLGIETNAEKVGVELQKATIGRDRIRRAGKRLLLGLGCKTASDGGSICDELDGAVTGESRPDAWLYGQDFVVLIESKVEDAPFELSQMRSHFMKLKVDARCQAQYQERTWAAVHRFFRELLPELNGMDKWLVEQFTEYLEYQGMTEFTGFDEWMFKFFVDEEKDPDEKKRIRHTMEGLGDEILHRGLRAISPFYEKRYVGNFGSRDDQFWMAFGPPGGPTELVKVAHQSVSLHDYGLDAYVNVRPPAIRMLRERLSNEKQRFAKIVSGLPFPFHIGISEHRMVRPRKSDEYRMATLEGGTGKPPRSRPYGLKDAKAAGGFDYLEKLLGQKGYWHFTLKSRIGRSEVLKLSGGGGDDLVEKVLSVMKVFHPLVEFINGTAERNG